MPINKTDALYQTLAERILDGQWVSGSRLPSEQELGDEFQVSRITVRAAIDRLRCDRVVYSVQGSGSYVGWLPEIPDGMHDISSKNPQQEGGHSFELIRCLEVEAAGLAAARRSLEDLRLMQTTLEAQQNANSLIELRREDIRFHEQVLGASKNPLFIRSIAQINAQDAGIVPVSGKAAQETIEQRIRASLEPHRAIFHAIETGDSASARSAMRYHLDQINDCGK